jgi:predicted DNA-binding transcriptional regulator AlpA
MAEPSPTVAACQLLTVKDVAALLKVHPRSVWRESARAETGLSVFPRPLRLGPKMVRWRLADVEAYVAALAGERP